MTIIDKILVKDVDYDIVGKELTKITYAELKALRDNSQLNEGHLYRITDYVTTTVQGDTKSANHPFDIIVQALSPNTLSELAQALPHEGNTYFEGNDLSAWELWYDIDNDTDKYEWADTTNGKGVIYRMIDEKKNDCPYDFKNILFYNGNYTESLTFDNYYFTFSYVVKGVLYDGTVEQQVKGCYSNSIEKYIRNKKHSLNKNVFRNTSFGGNCSSNTFGNYCYSNTFGGNCSSNTFGDYCYSNTFGQSCLSNTFVKSCLSNTFGQSCSSNTFGGNCSSNTFGDYCSYNTFGQSCYSNTFGQSCSSNTFGDNVSNRHFDQDKISITLNDEYYDDGTNQLVPIKHPDLSTQPNILPYKFMGNYVYELLIPVKIGDRIVSCDFMVEYPMILSAGVFGVNSFKNIDIIATKSDALLLNTESELEGYINVKYTDASQLFPSNGYGYGYGYEDNNTGSSVLIDFGVSSDGTIYSYNPNTETLSLYKSGTITENSIPQNLPQKNIILEEGVTGIGSYTFNNCSSLTSIEIPNSVTSIGELSFRGCSSLTSVVIGNSVTSIGDYAFRQCSNLTSIEIPNSVTTIGNSAFRQCSSLTSIVIPNSVTSIGELAFQRCSGLTSVVIGNSVTSIGSWAFDDCSGLTSVTIPNSVTSIGELAFRDCSSLTEIYIPESVISISDEVFSTYVKATYNVTDASSVVKLTGDTYLATDMWIEQVGGSLAITRSGSLFTKISSVDSYTFPEVGQYNVYINTGSYIESYAFNRCFNLASVEIPNNVTSIGDRAFRGCSGLTSIEIPSSVTYIGENAFLDVFILDVNFVNNSECSDANNWGATFYSAEEVINEMIVKNNEVIAVVPGTTEAIIPEGVTSIGEYAFENCLSLTSIEIPNSVTTIGNSAFCGCSGLTSIVIPEGVTSIGSYAFELCSNLTSVIISEGVTSIGDHAFEGCYNLTSVVIGNSVTSVGNWAFLSCSSLTSITSKATVSPTLGDNAFVDMPSTGTLAVPTGATGYNAWITALGSGWTLVETNF